MNDVTGLAEALLGLDGLRVLDVRETSSEVVVTVETTADVVGCATCVRAEAQDRLRVASRSSPRTLSIPTQFGRLFRSIPDSIPMESGQRSEPIRTRG
ncbi:MAG: hypothetical protein ACRET5_02190 [Steroidobacteraceae bacterium]